MMGTNPSHAPDCGPRCPVESVSWDDTQEFIRRLNGRELGRTYRYRLPTEAEWEYAARAGTSGIRYGELDEIAWYSDNSGGSMHPVGQKRANAWGLHDMLGNVWEWTADRYGQYPSDAVTDPVGSESGPSRVIRGGHWGSIPSYVRPGARVPHYSLRDKYEFVRGIPMRNRSSVIGFRLIRTE